MKTLLLMRHAKAVPDDGGLDDHSRPLAARGLKDAPLVGKALRKLGLQPESARVSSAVRNQQTFAGVMEGLRGTLTPALRRELYLAPPAQMLAELALTEPATANTVLLIGHNPGCEELAGWLCASTTSGFHISPGTMLAIELPIASWAELTPATRGQLHWMVTPKLLDALL